MVSVLPRLANRILITSFFLLFFLVPLALTPFNYELFEYNKMMLTYGITALIVACWCIVCIAEKRILLRRTPWDYPLGLFLLAQILSAVFSMDPHVSLWGYYSRFNGGLISTLCYVALFYIFTAVFPKEKIKALVLTTLLSGLLVGVYGILEHLGIDKHIWVQDVQNRVFSTLGQPNWLAAYLAVLLLIALGLGLRHGNIRGRTASFTLGTLGYFSLWTVLYVTLIFTKSRSGFAGFWLSFFAYASVLFLHYRTAVKKPLLTITLLLLVITFIFGAPFAPINRFSFPQLTHRETTTILPSAASTGGSIIDVGITESGTIRRIVWKGALDVAKHYPFFGSGVETFAFSYYAFRPPEHNMTSEWDFLYNKAHNEYLNYAATTGFFGLGSYLLLIGWFIAWNIGQWKAISVKREENFALDAFHVSLFAGWLSILVTNFFGFSVVIIQIFFFLIPAILFVLNHESRITNHEFTKANAAQKIGIFSILAALLFVLNTLIRMWFADVAFASGYNASRTGDYVIAYDRIKNAIEGNRNEPFYFDELAVATSGLSLAFAEGNQATAAARAAAEAMNASDIAVSTSPKNVNFWKTRTRVFYALSQFDQQYLPDAIKSLETAKELSPTDPKIRYNLALLYNSAQNPGAYKELEEATRLKPDYKDAFYALALFYERDKNIPKARESLEYILTKINPNDEEAKKKLEELK